MNSATTYAIIRAVLHWIKGEMPKIINLADKIEKQLPAELVNLMQAAGNIAQSQEQNLYLVGGVVRDLLLGKPNFDLDLVVKGDAIKLAQQLVQIKHGKITTHPHFNTAKLQWDEWSVDLATSDLPKPVMPTIDTTFIV